MNIYLSVDGEEPRTLFSPAHLRGRKQKAGLKRKRCSNCLSGVQTIHVHLKKAFKKHLRYQLIQRLNDGHSAGIVRLARFVETQPTFISAKIKSIDRLGIDLVAAERDGRISEIRLSFSRKAYDIQEAERLVLELIERGEG